MAGKSQWDLPFPPFLYFMAILVPKMSDVGWLYERGQEKILRRVFNIWTLINIININQYYNNHHWRLRCCRLRAMFDPFCVRKCWNAADHTAVDSLALGLQNGPMGFSGMHPLLRSAKGLVNGRKPLTSFTENPKTPFESHQKALSTMLSLHQSAIWGVSINGRSPKMDGLFHGNSINGWELGVPPAIRKPPYGVTPSWPGENPEVGLQDLPVQNDQPR